MHILNWSDLEYVLAVARRGSVAAAARELGVNHTTVLRRVKAFEQRQGLRIFERNRSGYRLTADGEVFLDAAKAIEATVADLDRKIAGGNPALKGELSITTTDSIFPFLAADIAEFRKLHPEIVPRLAITNSRLDLDSRDADIAIRASNAPPTHLVGRRVCGVGFGVYATPEAIEADARVPLAERRWIGVEALMVAAHIGEWMAKTATEDNIVLRSTSFVSQRALAEQGLGHALLPCLLGDDSTKLVRVPADTDGLSTGLWLLSHKDVLRSRRVRAGTDFLYRALRKKSVLFEGR
jgi:DNA-binding transcriptional LysR family regulator